MNVFLCMFWWSPETVPWFSFSFIFTFSPKKELGQSSRSYQPTEADYKAKIKYEELEIGEGITKMERNYGISLWGGGVSFALKLLFPPNGKCLRLNPSFIPFHYMQHMILLWHSIRINSQCQRDIPATDWFKIYKKVALEV